MYHIYVLKYLNLILLAHKHFDMIYLRQSLFCNSLIVKGSRSTEFWRTASHSSKSVSAYHKREIIQGPYQIVWPLPSNVDKDNVSAEFVYVLYYEYSTNSPSICLCFQFCTIFCTGNHSYIVIVGMDFCGLRFLNYENNPSRRNNKCDSCWSCVQYINTCVR